MVSELTPLAGTDLPLYMGLGDRFTVFYAPGRVAVTTLVEEAAFVRALVSGETHNLIPALAREAEVLRKAAVRAPRDYALLAERPYQPECLTLYLSERCPLGCVYCFAGAGQSGGPVLTLESVMPAARAVAAVCARKGLPFTLAVHGGGEPACHVDLISEILVFVADLAQSQGLSVFRYIATNGVHPPETLQWLADSFDLVGLSVDGPPDIQDSQRPLANGGGTSALVERAAATLRDAGVPVRVRSTITPASMARQSEIARYLCEIIQPESIVFEPVYRGGRAGDRDPFTASQAPLFLSAFLDASAVAAGYGIPLSLTGTREDEIHSAYCNLFRDVITLTPDGGLTACFKSVGGAEGDHVAIGSTAGGTLQFDPVKIDTLRRALSAVPPGCADCFNRFSCVRSCPDLCLLKATDPPTETPFRCALLKGLALHRIMAQAGILWEARDA